MLTKNQDIIAEFSGVEFSKYASKTGDFVKEFKSRANQKGQFLNWVNLPSEQLKRVDEIYELAQNLKNLTGAKKLSVMGIGGSKHTVEHMLSINGLNIKGEDIVFYSDVDSASLERFLYKLDNDVLSSNFMIASKSGSTFETKDGFLRVLDMLTDAYKAQGKSEEEAKKAANKHFIAVTDANAEKSELRRTSNENGWLGDLFIHDDVGGRFSAFDDHALFTLAYAGMKKEDIHLDYKDGILTISGEKNEEKEEKDRDKYLRREFTSYSFHRSFELPEERYDVAKAQAAYKDGILEVTLPKKEQKDKVSRQIEVK